MRNPTSAKSIAPRNEVRLVEKYQTRSDQWVYVYESLDNVALATFAEEMRASGAEVKQYGECHLQVKR